MTARRDCVLNPSREISAAGALEGLCVDEDVEIARAAQHVRRARDLAVALPLLEARLSELVTARTATIVEGAAG